MKAKEYLIYIVNQKFVVFNSDYACLYITIDSMMNISIIGIVLANYSEEKLLDYVTSIFIHVKLFIFFNMHYILFALCL